jgi:hypothetical protein
MHTNLNYLHKSSKILPCTRFEHDVIFHIKNYICLTRKLSMSSQHNFETTSNPKRLEKSPLPKLLVSHELDTRPSGATQTDGSTRRSPLTIALFTSDRSPSPLLVFCELSQQFSRSSRGSSVILLICVAS